MSQISQMKRAADEEETQRLTTDELKLTEIVFAVSFLEERPTTFSAVQLDGLRQEIQVASSFLKRFTALLEGTAAVHARDAKSNPATTG